MNHLKWLKYRWVEFLLHVAICNVAMQKVTPPTASILVVDDDEAIARLVGTYLRRTGFAADWALSEEGALQAVRRHSYDLLITDYQLVGQTGLELAQQVQRELRRRIPVVVMTAHGNIETAIAALRAGAADFLTKPFELSLLGLVVARALSHHLTTLELEALKSEVRRATETHGILGEHASVKTLRAHLERMAQAEGVVLVTGESGTGKELVARALHELGPRRAGPMVSINCGALPGTLLESELFGHVKGAFTDARSDRLGVFREADKGTLFLDEIGELPLQLQAAMLRVLQERVVRPVGANKEIKVDVRVVAATNRDLHTAATAGTFRNDLLFRLDVLRLDMPPLRERGDDVLLLFRHFLALTATRHGKQITSLAPDALELLSKYEWPGNVRELQNTVERAVLACDGSRLESFHLPESLSARPVPKLRDGWPLVSLEELERRHIEYVMGAVGGSRQRAADLLGIDRVTLYRKLKRKK
jgi:two-component system, NtrC family, response regulator HydG